MKKSGPTIDSFLKMQHQMGVAIVGCAAYRDADGKLYIVCCSSLLQGPLYLLMLTPV